jgi:hypothetical protein
MTSRAVKDEDPGRLYTVTGGRSRADGVNLDLVTLIVNSGAVPPSGMQSEYVRILQISGHPTAVVEIAADLRLPVSVVKILLSDLLRDRLVYARQPSSFSANTLLPDIALLERVLVGLQKL